MVNSHLRSPFTPYRNAMSLHQSRLPSGAFPSSARWESNPRIKALQASPLSILVLAHGQSDGTRTHIQLSHSCIRNRRASNCPTLWRSILVLCWLSYVTLSVPGGFAPPSPGLLCFRTRRDGGNRTHDIWPQTISYTTSLHPVLSSVSPRRSFREIS